MRGLAPHYVYAIEDSVGTLDSSAIEDILPIVESPIPLPASVLARDPAPRVEQLLYGGPRASLWTRPTPYTTKRDPHYTRARVTLMPARSAYLILLPFASPWRLVSGLVVGPI